MIFFHLRIYSFLSAFQFIASVFIIHWFIRIKLLRLCSFSYKVSSAVFYLFWVSVVFNNLLKNVERNRLFDPPEYVTHILKLILHIVRFFMQVNDFTIELINQSWANFQDIHFTRNISCELQFIIFKLTPNIDYNFGTVR